MSIKANGRVIGVDLGGTKIAAGVVDAAGQIFRRARIDTRAAEGPAAVVERMAGRIEALRRHAPDAAGVGVCAPGPVSSRLGAVMRPPNLPGWDYVPLRQILSERIGLPVWLDHDCRAAALAEHQWGAGRGADDMVYVTVSTGVGGGILAGGQLWRGDGESAGEIGHCTIDQNGPLCGCGRRGCVEAFASGTAVGRRARELLAAGRPSAILGLAGGQLELVTAREVTLAAQAGDPLALEVLHEAGCALGIGFAILANIVNPRRIVVGGSLSQHAGDLLLEPARASLRQWSVPGAADRLEVVPAALGDDVGILGAALLAFL